MSSHPDLTAARFVATLLHPAYWTNGASRNIEVKFNPETGDKEVILSRVVKEYLHVPPAKGIAVVGQPEPQASVTFPSEAEPRRPEFQWCKVLMGSCTHVNGLDLLPSAVA